MGWRSHPLALGVDLYRDEAQRRAEVHDLLLARSQVDMEPSLKESQLFQLGNVLVLYWPRRGSPRIREQVVAAVERLR